MRAVLGLGFYLVVSFLFVASVRYRFLHPEMTETQLLKALPAAVLFRP